MSSQIFHCGVSDGVGSESDSQACVIDLGISHTVEFHIVLIGPVPIEHGVGVCVHVTRDDTVL